MVIATRYHISLIFPLFVDGGNFFIMGKVSYNRIGTRYLMGFKLFWKVMEKNILKCVLHVKHDYFSHF